jgi:hypothetical protein
VQGRLAEQDRELCQLAEANKQVRGE